MSSKRSRTNYEADLRTQQPSFVLYGKPLPLQDPDVRDDGSFVPIWKQEVTDERGRKRLHGAFTGGFSAGYFNTVGSKEGWTPSTFVSSRANRVKDDKKAVQQKAEDFMDDEDLAEAAEAQKLHTTNDFAGIGSTEEALRSSVAIDLFRTQGETMGAKLMKKMGWREGQGVGPKIRRQARLNDLDNNGGNGGNEGVHFFAPENTRIISFIRKSDHLGLGCEGGTKLATNRDGETNIDSGDENQPFGTASTVMPKKKKKLVRSGIGIGVLNDTGSDDEDPYEIGPRISYNKVIGGDKKKKKPALNGAVRPMFVSKKAALARASTSIRKCHDGRLPLDGFVLSSDIGSSTSIITSDGKYLPPEIPEGWKSAKQPSVNTASLNSLTTAELARASKLDPKSRAALLGEAALPGKSVFDYLSSSARDRLASASGKTNLPPALGEIPQGFALTDEERRKEIVSQIPKVEKDTAIAALGRGASGWMPYAEDESKRSRYRDFLEYQAGVRDSLPQKTPGIKNEDWLKELQEFVHCAQIFRPMTGMMATRFTSSSTPTSTSNNKISSGADSLITKPAPKIEDPAEQAAKLGMFGLMTRSSQDFYPTRLLCKRFNVKPPAHVMLDPERTGDDTGNGASSARGFQTRDGQPAKTSDLVSKSAIDDILKETNLYRNSTTNDLDSQLPDMSNEIVVDPERNEALEGKRAGEAVFKAIFGDSDDDDDDDDDDGDN